MNQLAQASNPFGASQVTPAANNAVAHSDAERSIQEVQAAMVIAKKFPRNMVEAMDRILNACTRPTLANTALYSFPRGGQEISGPSIRLAEAIAQQWGNIQYGIRELSNDNGVSTVESFAWDIETNTRQTKTFQVKHVRHTRNGQTKLNDPRDIYEMVANQGARRLRACILGVIPGDVVESAVNQCSITQQNNVDVSPETIKKLVDTFEKEFGVNQELIEKRLGKRVEAINASQLLSLRNIYQSMRDGMSKPSAWFDVEEQTESVQPKTSDLNLKPKAKTEEPKPEQPAQSPQLQTLLAKLQKVQSVEDAISLEKDQLFKKLNPGEQEVLKREISLAADSFIV